MKSFLISCIVHFLNISQEIIIVVVNINTLTIFILSFVRLEITTIININNNPSAYSILSGWTLFHKKTLPINPEMGNNIHEVINRSPTNRILKILFVKTFVIEFLVYSMWKKKSRLKYIPTVPTSQIFWEKLSYFLLKEIYGKIWDKYSLSGTDPPETFLWPG